MQSDRNWFARNPHRSYRIRREIPGEFPDPPRVSKHYTPWTLIRQLEPGIRVRTRFAVLRGAAIDTDGSIGPLFNYLVTNPGTSINRHSPGAAVFVNAFRPPARGVA
jgi:hypothetical protein